MFTQGRKHKQKARVQNVFTHVACSKFIGTKERFFKRKKIQLPQDWFGSSLMTAVSLFWDKNIADVTSCEKALYAGAAECQLPVPFVC